MDNFREQLASLCHDQWSGWMKYLFSKGQFAAMGKWIMPVWAVERWTRQMATPYEELSEEEKENDRKEADKFIRLLEELKESPKWRVDLCVADSFGCLVSRDVEADDYRVYESGLLVLYKDNEERRVDVAVFAPLQWYAARRIR